MLRKTARRLSSFRASTTRPLRSSLSRPIRSTTDVSRGRRSARSPLLLPPFLRNRDAHPICGPRLGRRSPCSLPACRIPRGRAARSRNGFGRARDRPAAPRLQAPRGLSRHSRPPRRRSPLLSPDAAQTPFRRWPRPQMPTGEADADHVRTWLRFWRLLPAPEARRRRDRLVPIGCQQGSADRRANVLEIVGWRGLVHFFQLRTSNLQVTPARRHATVERSELRAHS